MAWVIAGYAASLALLAAAGCMVAATVRIFRILRKWDRWAGEAAIKENRAIGEYELLAQEARQSVEVWRRAIAGAARLAEGARAVGEAAESVAQAAVHTVDSWRGWIASWQSAAEEDGETDGILPEWWEVMLVRLINRFWKAGRYPGTSADPNSGE
jgi:hypothetical protein